MLYARAADLTAIVHAALIVFVLAGGFLAWRWPRLVWIHLPAVAVTAVIFLVGADCPLTDLERHFRREAGQSAYRDGFVAHYLLPMVPDTVRTVGVPLFVVGLNVAAYAGYAARRRARPGRGLGGRPVPTASRR